MVVLWHVNEGGFVYKIIKTSLVCLVGNIVLVKAISVQISFQIHYTYQLIVSPP